MKSTVLLGLLATLFLTGCPSGNKDNCQARDHVSCQDDALGWIDSCGEFSELIQACPCGCGQTADSCADCPCKPSTCGERGWTCGEQDDGCGENIFCGGCSGAFICSNGDCEDLLESVREWAPGVAAAFEGLDEVADGLSDEESVAIAAADDVLSAIAESHRPWLTAVFSDYPGAVVDGASLVVDGDLSDWPIEVPIDFDRAQEGAGVDILETRFFAGDGQLWFAFTSAAACTEDLAFLVYLDIDGLVSAEIEVAAYEWQGQHVATVQHVDDSIVLDPSGVTWACKADQAELSIPLTALGGLEIKPGASACLHTYDMTSTEGDSRFDSARCYLFGTAPRRGAAKELLALALDVPELIDDPETAVALSVQGRFWSDVTESALAERVRTDQAGMMRYALELSDWQAQNGIPADFSELGLEEKMYWSWRGQETVVYGALYLIGDNALLNLPRYEFVANDAEVLRTYRDLFVSLELPRTDLLELVGRIDNWVWGELHYCARPDLMDTWCANGFLDPQTCAWWEEDKAAGSFTLGEVDGISVPNNGGNSARFQLGYRAEHGYFKGDCVSHTTISVAIYQALGISATGWQYIAVDPDQSTGSHNFPVYFDPTDRSWNAWQLPSNPDLADAQAMGFVFLPLRNPFTHLLHHSDYDGWMTFDTFAWYHGVTYQHIADVLGAGIPVDEWNAMFWNSYPAPEIELTVNSRSRRSSRRLRPSSGPFRKHF